MIMKPTLIKIDINSIKENKDFGNTQTKIMTGRIVKFKAQYLPDYFINEKNCIILSWQEKDGTIYNIEGEIFSDELIERIFNENPKGIEVEIKNNSTTVNHAPIPKYSFTYKNTKVVCCECGEKIMTDDLQSDESSDGEYYSDKICPKCGAFDCCLIEYEKINDVVKNLNI